MSETESAEQRKAHRDAFLSWKMAEAIKARDMGVQTDDAELLGLCDPVVSGAAEPDAGGVQAVGGTAGGQTQDDEA